MYLCRSNAVGQSKVVISDVAETIKIESCACDLIAPPAMLLF